jgi:hypothetical protein
MLSDDATYYRFRLGPDGAYHSYIVSPVPAEPPTTDLVDLAAAGLSVAQRVRLLLLRSAVLDARLGLGRYVQDVGRS